MKKFLDENFLLETTTAQKLYFDYAEKMPIIDYHSHLNPNEIADNLQFDNITQAWLKGDHYKWRAMRTNGVEEECITGNVSDFEKFEKWAETVPNTLRNPLYHWTHMELQRYFNVTDLLKPSTANEIYSETTEKLQSDGYTVRGLLEKMNVELVCTTDDPVDSLEYHIKIKESGFGINVFPTWRPDKVMAVENIETYNAYVDKLSEVAKIEINSYESLLQALKSRQNFFHECGCRLSDHGIETFYVEEYTESEVQTIFSKIRSGKVLDMVEQTKLKSALFYELAVMDSEKGWTQQFHAGAMRNVNSRMFKKLGADTGFDTIGEYSICAPMAKFFDKLAVNNKLAKTIIYNLNPKDNYLFASMIGNFQDGSVPGKMQFGSGWWFLDQKEGMTNQINALSNMGLLSRFVGMLTDSRSYLSFPRHEYFRRILCNILGNDVENGEIPNDMESLGNMVKNICYFNAKNYFNFE